MRVGKKPTSAPVVDTTKKTRACVVRLEAIHQQDNAKITRSAIKSGSEEKSSTTTPMRGPLKKRPISEATSITPAAVVATSRPRGRPPRTPGAAQTALAKTAKTSAKHHEQEDQEDNDTPTVAVGRSRRAIKPNPKYAGDDMITPKSLKDKDDRPHQQRGRKRSAEDSLDEFLSESGDENELYEIEDENAQNDEDMHNKSRKGTPQPQPRKRGRPPKSAARPEDEMKRADKNDRASLRRSTSTPNSTDRPAGRPARAAAVAANSSLAASLNRKRQSKDTDEDFEELEELESDEEESSSDEGLGFGLKKIRRQFNNNNKPATSMKSGSLLDRSVTLPTLNGSKMMHQKAGGAFESQKPKIKIEARLESTQKLPTVSGQASGSAKGISKLTSSSTPTTIGKTTIYSRSIAGLKQRPGGVTGTSTTPTSNANFRRDALKKGSITISKVSSGSAPPLKKARSDLEDFEDATPTFTIVNINDIINKKGDVLISKAKSPKSSSSGSLVVSNNNSPISPIKTPMATPKGNESTNKTLPTARSTDRVLDALRNSRKGFQSPVGRQTQLSGKSEAGKPNILNHTLAKKEASRQQHLTGGRKAIEPIISTDRPKPRILNAMVAKRTLPVKPMIANYEDSPDECFTFSMDEDEERYKEGESQSELEEESLVVVRKQQQPQRQLEKPRVSTGMITKGRPKASTRQLPPHSLQPKQKLLVTESSLPPERRKLLTKQGPATKPKEVPPTLRRKESPMSSPSPSTSARKTSPEKVTITRDGNKIIKRVTCFENWYVLSRHEEPPKQNKTSPRNHLEIPLVDLANEMNDVRLPNERWNTKVTLFELSEAMLAKGNYGLYTGDLKEHKIPEDDRSKYQPSCVMFRRHVEDKLKSKLPFDRAVIFKNKSFFTNIEGKNVRLVAAPNTIKTREEVEILLEIVDSLTLQSKLVEPAASIL